METILTRAKPILGRGRGLLIALATILMVLVLAAISIPNLLRSRIASEQAARYVAEQKLAGDEAPGAPVVEARRVVSTGEMRLVAEDPAQAAEEIAAVARNAGGYVERSDVFRGNQQAISAQITIRVPAARLEEVRTAIRRLGKRTEVDRIHADDVSGQYVDLEATLRNYHAEEAQYLDIMRRAGTIKDTLEVAQRLNEVRNRIQRTQAQFNLLSHQVQMASLSVSLQPEAAPMAEWSWSPLRQLRSAWADALRGFAQYADAMMAVVFYSPLVLAWAFTIAGLAAVAWRLGRWVWRHWFAPVVSQPAA